MSVIEDIYNKAKARPQKVAFPEAQNEKMMQAAYETGKEGYAVPILVGSADALKTLAERRGYDTTVFHFVDIHNEEHKGNLIEKYTSMSGKILKEKALRRRMEDPLYYALVMESVGEADVTFVGIDISTEDVLLAGQMVIGLKPGIDTVSSVALCDIKGFEGSEGSLLAIADSAVCTNPTPQQLASIAISACDTIHDLLDWEPRCAMLSYSTLGSGHGELVDKVKTSLKIAQSRRPDLQIDGEFQLDSALIPAIAQKKIKRESPVAGKANIIIWPDLNAGNIGVKLIQLLGQADAYGPMLQGFNRIVCDCSRGAPVSEIKGNIIISCVRAQVQEG